MSVLYKRDFSHGKVNIIKSENNIECDRNRLPKEAKNKVKDVGKGGTMARSQHGFDYSEATSALQKAIRRGNGKEAIQWALERFWASPSARTNVWNRLITIAVEDISPKHFDVLLSVYNIFCSSKDNPLAIATCANELAKAKKSRINDWYLLDVKYKYISSRIKRGLAWGDCDLEVNLVKEKQYLVKYLKEEKYDEAMLTCARINWCGNKPPKIMSGNGNKSRNVIWLSIAEMCRTKNKYGRRYIPSMGRKYASCLNSILTINSWKDKGRKEDDVDGTPLLWSAFINAMQIGFPDGYGKFDINESLKDLVNKYNKGKGLVGVPDYALDKHTGSGRRKGRGMIHFIEEASAVVDEDEDYIDKIAEYIPSFMRNININWKNMFLSMHRKNIKSDGITHIAIEDKIWIDVAESYGRSIVIATTEASRYRRISDVEIIDGKPTKEQQKLIINGKREDIVFVFDDTMHKTIKRNIENIIDNFDCIQLYPFYVSIDCDGEYLNLKVGRYVVETKFRNMFDGNLYVGDNVGKTKKSKWYSEEKLENYVFDLYKSGNIYDLIHIRNKEIYTKEKGVTNANILEALNVMQTKLLGIGEENEELDLPEINLTEEQYKKESTPTKGETKVVNVKVKYIRPKYQDLNEWMKDENNIYIGRRVEMFGKVLAEKESPFHNPYKTSKYSLEDSLKKYEKYIRKNIDDGEITKEMLLGLKGKNLGCWCKPDKCHGDVLKKIVDAL